MMKRIPAHETRNLVWRWGSWRGLAFAGQARAQALRPNIMFIFDTSGSMLDSQSRTGRRVQHEHDEHDSDQTSRIYRLKSALRDALAQVGADEANFGLMRFPQVETGTTSTCPQRALGATPAPTPVAG